VCALLSACHTDELRSTSTRSTSPTIVAVDSVLLEENDTSFVGQPGAFAASPDGSFYIADALNSTVHHFRSDGKILRPIGRRGHGPGEYVQPGILALDGDSLLYVRDEANRVVLFDVGSGRQRWERHLPWAPIFELATNHGRLIFNVLDSARKTSLGVVGSAYDSVRFTGPFPVPLGRFPWVDRWFSWARVASLGEDSIAVVLKASSDYVYFGALGGGRFDSVHVNVRRRRGARSELYANLTKDPNTMLTPLYRTSHPWALTALSDGKLGYVIADQERVRGRFTASLFVSVVDLRSRTSCADAEVPVPTDPQPFATFRGDTLLVLKQDLTRGNKAVAFVLKYALKSGECDWTP
jgi:hypothetical protein